MKEGICLQLRSDSVPRRWLVTGGALVTLAGLGFALRGLLAQVAALILGAGVLSFVAAPLARLYEGKLSRAAASLAALLSIGAAAVGLMLSRIENSSLPPRELMIASRFVPRASTIHSRKPPTKEKE